MYVKLVQAAVYHKLYMLDPVQPGIMTSLYCENSYWWRYTWGFPSLDPMSSKQCPKHSACDLVGTFVLKDIRQAQMMSSATQPNTHAMFSMNISVY